MLPNSAATHAGHVRALTLPVDLRMALEFIVTRTSSFPSPIEARIVGHPELICELRRYASSANSSRRVIGLSVEQERLWNVLREMRPECVLILVGGPLAQLVQPLRSDVVRVASDLPSRAWRSAGYERASSHGFLGPGAMGWAAVERAARTFGRPDLADRSRIAMRQCASSSRAGRLLSTILVRKYRRVR
jgi:hypothetical protein